MKEILREGVPGVEAITSRTAAENESPSQHTPAPWSVAECSGIHDHMVVDSMGVVIAEIYDADGRYAANAAFIVRACNHHETLLAALKDAIDGFNDVASQAALCADQIGATERQREWLRAEVRNESDGAIAKLRAAIQHAEGKYPCR